MPRKPSLSLLVLGARGHGKTTLLHSIGGLLSCEQSTQERLGSFETEARLYRYLESSFLRVESQPDALLVVASASNPATNELREKLRYYTAQRPLRAVAFLTKCDELNEDQELLALAEEELRGVLSECNLPQDETPIIQGSALLSLGLPLLLEAFDRYLAVERPTDEPTNLPKDALSFATKLAALLQKISGEAAEVAPLAEKIERLGPVQGYHDALLEALLNGTTRWVGLAADRNPGGELYTEYDWTLLMDVPVLFSLPGVSLQKQSARDLLWIHPLGLVATLESGRYGVTSPDEALYGRERELARAGLCAPASASRLVSLVDRTRELRIVASYHFLCSLPPTQTSTAERHERAARQTIKEVHQRAGDPMRSPVHKTPTSRRVSLEEFLPSYRRTFFSNPWGHKVPAEEAAALFQEINQILFDNFSRPLEIRSWSTDWSYLFAAGNEWWGAYLWTISLPDKPGLIGIFASATD